MDLSSGIRKRFRRAWQRRRAPALEPTDAILRSIGHPDEGTIDMLRALVRKDPKHGAALARALREMGREAEAQNALDGALERRPHEGTLSAEATRLTRHRWAPIKQGLALLRGNEPAAAKDVFCGALNQIGGRCPIEALFDILCGIGWCDQKLELATGSLAVFERAARLKPNRLDAAFGAGLALRMLGRERDARIALARAATLESTASGPFAFIGWCHHEAARRGPARRAFTAALSKNRRDLEAAWGMAWSLWADGNADDATTAFKHAIRCGLHASATELMPLIPAYGMLTALERPLSTALLDAGRLDEAETVATDPDLVLRILVAGGRMAEALEHKSANGTRCGLALRALVNAGLALGQTTDALGFAMRLDEPERTRARAEVHQAAGEFEKALEVRRGESAATLPETASEIERLRRAAERRGLTLFGTEDLPEPGPTRCVAVRHRARQLAAAGKPDEARALLSENPDDIELLEELIPAPTNETPRGYLAALLEGIQPVGSMPKGPIGLLARLILSDTPPSSRNLRRLSRFVSKQSEDALLSRALRELLQREHTA